VAANIVPHSWHLYDHTPGLSLRLCSECHRCEVIYASDHTPVRLLHVGDPFAMLHRCGIEPCERMYKPTGEASNADVPNSPPWGPTPSSSKDTE
jgi:hypothetical protein